MTDASGRAAVRGLAEGEWVLTVRHPQTMAYVATLRVSEGQAAPRDQREPGEGGRLAPPAPPQVLRGRRAPARARPKRAPPSRAADGAPDARGAAPATRWSLAAAPPRPTPAAARPAEPTPRPMPEPTAEPGTVPAATVRAGARGRAGARRHEPGAEEPEPRRRPWRIPRREEPMPAPQPEPPPEPATAPAVLASQPAAESVAPPRPAGARSGPYEAGTCPECRPREWSVTAEGYRRAGIGHLSGRSRGADRPGGGAPGQLAGARSVDRSDRARRRRLVRAGQRGLRAVHARRYGTSSPTTPPAGRWR